MKAQLPINTTKAELKLLLFVSELSISARQGITAQWNKLSIVRDDAHGHRSYLSSLSYYIFNILKQGLRENFLGSETEMEFVMIMLRHYANTLTQTITAQAVRIKRLSTKNDQHQQAA